MCTYIYTHTYFKSIHRKSLHVQSPFPKLQETPGRWVNRAGKGQQGAAEEALNVLQQTWALWAPISPWSPGNQIWLLITVALLGDAWGSLGMLGDVCGAPEIWSFLCMVGNTNLCGSEIWSGEVRMRTSGDLEDTTWHMRDNGSEWTLKMFGFPSNFQMQGIINNAGLFCWLIQPTWDCWQM